MMETATPVNRYFNIRTKSPYARLAAFFMKSSRMAMVLGNTIHIYGVSKEDFLENRRWVRHELTHIAQFKEHGFVLFLLKYIWEWVKKGYTRNKYEVAARAAESDESIY